MNSTSIATLREIEAKILVCGNHVRIIQSILDFDYASGRETPSVVAIIAIGRKSQKFFWGNGETLVPVFATMQLAQIRLKNTENEPDFLGPEKAAGR